MPDGEKESNSPSQAGAINPAILSGKTWNRLIDILLAITPRGDDGSISVVPFPSGSIIYTGGAPNGPSGGESGSNLPLKVKNESAPVIIKPETWNQLLDYIETITPRGSEQVEVDVTPSGSIIKALKALSCEGTYYFDVTVTGGSQLFPFNWLGQTWTSSGQTNPVCGGGTQAQGQTTGSYRDYGYQNWEDTATGTPTGTLKFNNSYYDGIYPFTPSFSDENVTVKAKKSGSFSMLVRWERNAITGSIYGSTYYNTTNTVESTSNLNTFSPAANALIDPADYKLFSAMNGSLTTTAGRTVAWTASPSFPWDYPDPEE